MITNLLKRILGYKPEPLVSFDLKSISNNPHYTNCPAYNNKSGDLAPCNCHNLAKQ